MQWSYPSKWSLVFFLVCFAYVIVIGERDRREAMRRTAEFRANWNSLVVGRIAGIQVIENHAGIIRLNLDSIVNDQFGVDKYRGGPFYLLTKGKRAKLMETGLSDMKRGDLIVITKDGRLLVLRGSEQISSTRIYFRDSYLPFWDRVSTKDVTEYWNWKIDTGNIQQ